MATPRYADLLARLDGVRALGVELGLERVRRALAILGDPQRRFAAVQLAGTNGKGSTAAMTDAVLRAAGVRTGLYTSPHLSRFTERIRVAGVEVDGDHLAALDARVAATGVPLTYFEVATALAFLAFAEDGVEIAVVETGLGGRLDAVTTCEPVATAITSIALDHTDYLGDTLREIAREKAGIIKPDVPCFLGTVPPEAEEEIARVAAGVGAPLLRVGRDFVAPDVPLALPGSHQRENAALAVALAQRAAAARGRVLHPSEIARGLAEVRWPGRLERLGEDLLLDCAHNVEGARALAAALPALAADRPVALVTSIVQGKEASAILEVLAPHVTAIVATASRNPRSLPATAVASLARAHHANTHLALDPLAALDLARRLLGPGVLVVVAGSIFLVGELRAHFLGSPVDPLVGSDPV